MTDNSLIAPVESSREAWTGSGLADSIEGLVDAIKSEGWVDDALAGATLGVEVAASVMDPISALLANGLGWAMEYFEPLREMLDELTGKPDVVQAHAATWNNMATELKSMTDDLQLYLDGDLPDWQGEAAEAYQRMMANNTNAIGGLAAISAAMAVATEGAGGLVELTREIVRDLFADLVARVRLLAFLALAVRFALHRRTPDGDSPGRPPDAEGRPAQQHDSVNAGEGVTSAQNATDEIAQQGRPSEGTSARDVHGQLRTGEREVDVDHVWRDGEMYIQQDGQIVKILDNGDGTYSVVVRDMSNPSGRPTTVIADMTQKQVQSRIDRGIWE